MRWLRVNIKCESRDRLDITHGLPAYERAKYRTKYSDIVRAQLYRKQTQTTGKQNIKPLHLVIGVMFLFQ